MTTTTVRITCRELVEFLDDYIANEIPAEQLADVERHLAACPTCVAYMNTYRESVRMGRRLLCTSPDALVDDVPPDLVRAILAARARRG